MENTLEIPVSSPPVVSSGRMRVERAETLDEVDAWQQQWTELARPLDSPMAQFEWTRPCLAFPTGVPNVIAIEHGGRFVAIAPLVRRRVRGIHACSSPV